MVDECQNVAVRTTRRQLAASRSAPAWRSFSPRTSDALILTSATPHDGRPESFASLMNLLEPTAIADETNYTSDEIERPLPPPLQEGHRARGRGRVPGARARARRRSRPRRPRTRSSRPLDSIEFKTIARERKRQGRPLPHPAAQGLPLVAGGLLIDDRQAPRAQGRCRTRRLRGGSRPTRSSPTSRRLVDDGRARRTSPSSRSSSRCSASSGSTSRICTERVVIFSERIDTLELPATTSSRKDLGLKADQIEVFHGTLDDQKQQGPGQELRHRETARSASSSPPTPPPRASTSTTSATA